MHIKLPGPRKSNNNNKKIIILFVFHYKRKSLTLAPYTKAARICRRSPISQILYFLLITTSSKHAVFLFAKCTQRSEA